MAENITTNLLNKCDCSGRQRYGHRQGRGHRQGHFRGSVQSRIGHGRNYSGQEVCA